MQQTDDNGHGSHVAGTIAGATFGVAKKAQIKGVKVLDARGAGQNSGILNGLQFVIDDVNANNLRGKAVLNMSLGGSKSPALNRAIPAAFNAGIVPVVAAGNDNVRHSPCSKKRANLVLTIAAERRSRLLAGVCPQRHHRRRH